MWPGFDSRLAHCNFFRATRCTFRSRAILGYATALLLRSRAILGHATALELRLFSIFYFSGPAARPLAAISHFQLLHVFARPQRGLHAAQHALSDFLIHRSLALGARRSQVEDARVETRHAMALVTRTSVLGAVAKAVRLRIDDVWTVL